VQVGSYGREEAYGVPYPAQTEMARYVLGPP
jgi:hypothetical protein